MKKTYLILSIASLSLLFSCKKDDHDHEPHDHGAGEQELITRLELHLTNSTLSSDIVIAKFNDPEGEGKGADPTIDTLKVKAGTTYNAVLKIYDDTKSPVDTISGEIKEEANAHRFHYTYSALGSTATTLNVTITDNDTKNPPLPLGLTLTINTGTIAGLGKLNINLRHFDDANKTNNPTDGEQDINVDFPVKIQ
jgi:hypothetical protein